MALILLQSVSIYGVDAVGATGAGASGLVIGRDMGQVRAAARQGADACFQTRRPRPALVGPGRRRGWGCANARSFLLTSREISYIPPTEHHSRGTAAQPERRPIAPRLFEDFSPSPDSRSVSRP